MLGPGLDNAVLAIAGVYAPLFSRVARGSVIAERAKDHVVAALGMDPELTRQTRRSLVERLERERILVAAGHFPAPGFGRIVRLNGRRYWQGL